MKLVQPVGGERREQVRVQHVDAGGIAFGAVGRRAVGGDVECFVFFARMIEIVGGRQPRRRAEIHVAFQQHRDRLDRVIDRLPFVLVEARLKEIEQRQTLAIGLGVDQGRIRPGWSASATGQGVPIVRPRFCR